MIAFIRNTHIKKVHLFALVMFTFITGALIVALDTNQGLLQNSQNPASSYAASGPTPVGQSGSWNMIFDDEFSNTSIDSTKWTLNWFGTNNTSLTVPVNSNSTNCFDPAQSSEGNGILNLTAVSNPCTVGGTTYPYRSGIISSNGKFSYTYGFMEARIWLPGTNGTWPAFWADGQNWPMTGEIDALETWSSGDQEFHYHYGNSTTNYGPGGGSTVAGAFSGWHTFATDWEPGVVKWYYDGNLVWTLTNANLVSGYSITSSPLYLILFLQLYANPSTVPTTMKVDYVRVWQKCTTNCTTTTPTPTPTATPTPKPTVTPTPTPTPKPTVTPTPTPTPKPTATPTPTPTSNQAQSSNSASISSFTTGFETGQPQLNWTNAVDNSGLPAGGTNNVSGITSSVSGPESGIRNEATHNGSSALMYSGKDNSTTSSYAYMKIFDLSSNPLLVASNTVLSYWIYPQSSSTTSLVSGNNSSCVAIDLVFSDGSVLRNSGAVDQYGNKMHPSSQCGHLTLDKWNNVISNIGTVLSGKKIIRIDIGYDQPANTGGYRGYLDDLSIVQNMLLNGNFIAPSDSTDWLSPWTMHTNSGYSQWWQSSTGTNGYHSFTEYTSELPVNYWDTQLFQGGIPLISGNKYTITFYAKADVSSRPLNVVEQLGISPWTSYYSNTINVTNTFTQYTLTFTAPVSISNSLLTFNFGMSTGEIWISQVSLTSN